MTTGLTFEFPDDPRDKAALVSSHADFAESRLGPRKLRWRVAHAYLNGVRRFVKPNFATGDVTVLHLADDDKRKGRLPLALSDLLAQVNEVQGMLASLDVRPVTSRVGSSLQSIRDAATAQVILDSITDTSVLETARRKIAHILTYYGSVAVHGHMANTPRGGLSGHPEVVHPMNVFPWPSISTDYTTQQGVVRQRIVTVSWLRERFGARAINRLLPLMDVFSLMPGDSIDEALSGGSNLIFDRRGRAFQKTAVADPEKLVESVVKIRELWLWEAEDGACSRYMIVSGSALIEDQDFTEIGAAVRCPLTWRSFIDTGDPYGAGMFDMLFSYVREFEKFMEDLIQNVRDADQYPVVLIPQGVVNKRTLAEDDGRKMQFIMASTDPKLTMSGQTFNPIVLQPVNAGETPGRTAAFLKQAMQEVSPISNILRDKGRVDSLSGLQFLDERGKQSLTPAFRSYVDVFKGFYRWALSQTVRELILSGSINAIPIKELSLGLLGAVIDFDRQEIRFTENSLPDPDRVAISVRQETSRSDAIRKQEALTLLQAGISSPERFLLHAVNEGIDWAMWMESEKSAHEMFVQNALALYGDGQRGAQIFVGQHLELPGLQLMELDALLGSPVMRAADPRIINAFLDWRDLLVRQLQPILPPQVPEADELAAVAAGPQGALPGPQ